MFGLWVSMVVVGGISYCRVGVFIGGARFVFSGGLGSILRLHPLGSCVVGVSVCQGALQG